MKKIPFLLLALAVSTALAQNETGLGNESGSGSNPFNNESIEQQQQQYAINWVNTDNNPPTQIQVQQQIQYVPQNPQRQDRGYNPVNQQKYGQSIRLSSGSGSSSRIGSSGYGAKTQKKMSVWYKIKKKVNSKGKFHPPKHYAKKKRFTKCHRFK